MNDRLINNQNLSDAEIARAELLNAKERIAEGVNALKRTMPLHKKALSTVSGGLATAHQYFNNRIDMFKTALPVEFAATPDATVSDQPNREPIDEIAKLDADYTFESTGGPTAGLDADVIRQQIDELELNSLDDTNFRLAA